MSNIHPTAIIGKNVEIAEDVTIGSYCVLGNNITLHKGVNLISHVTINKNTEINQNTTIYPFTVIGFAPQDLKYEGEETRVIIGKNTTIREYVSIHLATKTNPTLTTSVGDNCLLMGGTHVAHDCKVGNNVILANNTILGGHVEVGDGAIIGGLSAVHQFTRVGRLAFLGGGSIVTEDIIPYALYTGARRDACINGLNLIGLKRRGYTYADLTALKGAYQIIFNRDYSLAQKVNMLEQQYNDNIAVQTLIDFLNVKTSRHINLYYRANK